MAGRIAYLGNIVTQGLVLDLDAAIKGSYPGTGSIWTDVSNNGNNGTLTNGPAFSSADYGAIVFDGTNDFVDCGTGSLIPNSWTLGGWINQKLVTGTGVIIAKSAGAPLYEQNGTLGWTSTRSSSFYVGGKLTNGNYYYECTSSVFTNTGSIFNIVGTFNEPTTTLNLYINGAPANTKNTGFSMTLTGSQMVQVGCSDGITRGNFFSGSIYQTQIYNQALTQFQIWNNFNAYKSRYGIPDIVTDGLVLNLDAGNPYSYLSGSSGTTWSNTVAVSSSISGTLVNGTTYSNGAMVFDGTNDYVSIPAHPTSSGLTLSFWAYIPSTLGTLPTLIGDGSQSNTVGYIWIYRSDINQVTWQFATSTVRRLINDSTIFAGSLNSWANYVFVADYTNYPTGSLTTYKNGVLSTTTTFPNIQIPLSRTRFIGSYDGGSLFPLSGSISSYVEYDRALSATEITQNFNALRGRYGI